MNESLKVAIVSTVKGPLTEISAFINYHLNIGVDEIILFFDDPNDLCIEHISKYKNVHLIRCTDDYWVSKLSSRPDVISQRQTINATEGIEIAKKLNCKWIIHIDRDELIYSNYDFKSVLLNSDADIIRFWLREAIPEFEDYSNIFQPKYFKVNNPSKKKIQIAKLFGCSNIFYGEQYFRGHTRSKVATRISSKIRKISNHGPVEYDKENTKIENTSQIKLLHFDSIGFDDWHQKNSNKPHNSENIKRSAHRRLQFQDFVNAKAKGISYLRSLYKEKYIIPRYQVLILSLIKMAEKISIDKQRFEMPIV